MYKITISLRLKERKMLDEILDSEFLKINTAEEAIRWSLGVAKIVLMELDRLIDTKKNRDLDIPTQRDIFNTPGILPDIAESPLLGETPNEPHNIIEDIYRFSKNLE